MSYKTIVRLFISFIFLAYVLVKVDMRFLYEALLSVRPTYYIISFLILISNSIILAQKYKIVMKPSGIYQSLVKLIGINFICRFYSMFFTTAIGQSVIRWHISTKNQEGRSKFVAVMLFERSSFLFVLFFIVMISLVLVANPVAKTILYTTLPLLVAGLLGILLYYFYLNSSWFHRSTNRFCSYVYGKIQNEKIHKISQFTNAFSMYYYKKKIVLSGLYLAFVWHLFFLLRVYLLTISSEVSLSFVQISWMASFVLLLQILPITLNGIGIRETAYAYLFRIQDLPPEKGVLLGILLFSQMLIMSFIGGILHLLSKE